MTVNVLSYLRKCYPLRLPGRSNSEHPADAFPGRVAGVKIGDQSGSADPAGRAPASTPSSARAPPSIRIASSPRRRGPAQCTRAPPFSFAQGRRFEPPDPAPRRGSRRRRSPRRLPKRPSPAWPVPEFRAISMNCNVSRRLPKRVPIHILARTCFGCACSCLRSR